MPVCTSRSSSPVKKILSHLSTPGRRVWLSIHLALVNHVRVGLRVLVMHQFVTLFSTVTGFSIISEFANELTMACIYGSLHSVKMSVFSVSLASKFGCQFFSCLSYMITMAMSVCKSLLCCIVVTL